MFLLCSLYTKVMLETLTDNIVSVPGVGGLIVLSILIAGWAAFGTDFNPIDAFRKPNQQVLTRRESLLLGQPLLSEDDEEENGKKKKNPLKGTGLDKLAKRLTPNEIKLKQNVSSEKLLTLRELIIQSGNPYHFRSISEFYGTRGAMTVGFGLAGFIIGLFIINPVVFGVIGAVLGWFLLPLDMKGRKNTRAKEVLKVLPESLDMLNVVMGAGATFERAFKETAKRIPDSILKPELASAAADLESGRSTKDTLDALSDKFDSEDLRTFVRAIERSVEMGSDVSHALEQNANLVRGSYESEVSQKIAKLGDSLVLIFIPFAFVPAIIALLFLPVLDAVQNSMGNGLM